MPVFSHQEEMMSILFSEYSGRIDTKKFLAKGKTMFRKFNENKATYVEQLNGYFLILKENETLYILEEPTPPCWYFISKFDV